MEGSYLRDSQAHLVALQSARTELNELLKDTMRRRMSARMELWTVKAAELDPDFAAQIAGAAKVGSPAALVALVARLADEEAQTLHLIARIDARIEEVSQVVEWSTH